LTAPQVDYVNGRAVTAPGLVDQLGDAIAGPQGTGNRGAARSLPNVWVDAVDVLNDIDTVSAAWRNALPPMRTPPAKPATTGGQRIRDLVDRAWRPQDVARMEKITAVLLDWAVDIGEMLDPPRKMTLSTACPACGETTTHRRDKGGDRVRVPVLQVVADRGCTCLACGTHWAPALYTHLSMVLGFELPAGVFE
jgi:hypothetical protein